MAPEEQGATLGDFVTAGLIDDADVKFQSVRWIKWDYKGKVAEPVLGLQINIEDGDGNVHEDVLSGGDLKFFVPSEDGKKAIPLTTQVNLNINTNAAALLISIINADKRGELANRMKTSSDVSILDNLACHIVRKAQPKRQGIIQAPGMEGTADTAKAKTSLTVEKINAYPWEAGKGATAPAATKAAAAAGGNGAAAATDGTAIAALGVLMSIIADAGGSIKRGAIAGKVFTHADVKTLPAPEKNAILGLIVRDEFLASETVTGAGLVFDKAAGTVGFPQ